MKYLLFHLLLKPLIKRNYRLRQQGKLPDEWYWADEWAMSHGCSKYYVGMVNYFDNA